MHRIKVFKIKIINMKERNQIVHVLSNGKKLTKKEFLRYFESKVFYTIRKFGLIGKKDKIAVAFSGGKDSIVLLFILNKLCKARRQSLIAIAIDEGINDYRKRLLEQGKKFCSELDIPLKVFSFKKEFGFNLADEKIKKKIAKLRVSYCHVCSVLKRWLLNKLAQKLKIDVVATAHSLDDECENILLNLFKGNPELLAKLGPKAGVNEKIRKAFVQRIKPLYLCSTQEILLYAKLVGLPVPKDKAICPMRGETFRVDIRNWLEKMDNRHIEVKNAIVSSFLKLLPMLHEKYKESNILKCKSCGFASNNEECKACLFLKELKKR